jgi:hypothetical protein
VGLTKSIVLSCAERLGRPVASVAGAVGHLVKEDGPPARDGNGCPYGD